MSEKFNSLLAASGTTVNIGDLGLNTHGVCSLRFDGDMVVNIEPEEDTDIIHVYGKVCAIPKYLKRQNTLYTELLTANFFGNGTGLEARFSIHPHDKEVLLSQSINITTLTTEEFLNSMQRFVNILEIWRQQIKENDLA